MISKIWNSFLYGNKKTKMYILAVFILIVASIAFLIVAIVSKVILWGLGTAFSLILAVIIMQSVAFKGSGTYKPAKKEKDKKGYKQKESGNVLEKQKIDLEENDTKAIEESSNRSEYFATLRQSDVHRIMVNYKVKKEHYPVIVDTSKSEHIWHCPAFLWKAKGHVFILLLEKETRSIKIPISKITHIKYEPGIIANKRDYEELQRPSFVSLTFGNLIPTCYEENIKGKITLKKNLYSIEPDIRFTNTSVRALMNLLKIDVKIYNNITNSNKASTYFKEAYKINLLWKDGVYATTEFKTKIKEMLQNMAEAEISSELFSDYMNQLVAGRLVTKEYAEYYMDYHQRYGIKKLEKRRN